eukprot:432924-Amphidinium_carterae.1
MHRFAYSRLLRGLARDQHYLPLMLASCFNPCLGRLNGSCLYQQSFKSYLSAPDETKSKLPQDVLDKPFHNMQPLNL